jgi:hypothetical protein
MYKLKKKYKDWSILIDRSTFRFDILTDEQIVKYNLEKYYIKSKPKTDDTNK